MSNVVLEANNLRKSYLQGETTIDALKDVSLNVTAGEFVMVTGESGSGKSTLLKLCGVLDKPDGGKLTLFSEDTSALSEKQFSALRREKLGFIFQNFHLIPVLSVLENIEYAFKLRRIPYSLSSAKELLQQVGLEEKMYSLASSLSGGQMQRVAIARALVGSPELILADEPTANLDTQNKAAVMEALTRLCRERNTTILLVTHDLSLSQWIERSIQLRDGYGDFIQ